MLSHGGILSNCEGAQEILNLLIKMENLFLIVIISAKFILSNSFLQHVPQFAL